MQPIRIPKEPPRVADEETAALQRMSAADRGRLIAAACRAAARIHHSRLKAGLPPIQREPWPDSTWEFLAQQAKRVRS